MNVSMVWYGLVGCYEYENKTDEGSGLDVLAVEVSILIAVDASDVVAVVEVVGVEHLLDGLDTLREEAAHPTVLPLALLAEHTSSRRTLAYHMAPLVALIAHCPLRTTITAVSL